MNRRAAGRRAKSAGDAGKEDLAGLIDATKEATLVAKELERTKGAYVDLFDTARQAFDTFADSVARGTLDMGALFESLKFSIIRSFADAFAEGLKEKAGFEGALKINLVQFLGNLGGIIQGRVGEGGLVGTLLTGVFGQGALGTLIQQGASAVLGRIPVIGSFLGGGGTAPLGGSVTTLGGGGGGGFGFGSVPT